MAAREVLTMNGLGDYQKAIDNYAQALSIAREIGDKRTEGSWLGSQGNAYHGLGDYQKAIGSFKQALSTLSPLLSQLRQFAL